MNDLAAPAAAPAEAPPAAVEPGRIARWSDRLNPILVREVRQALKARAFPMLVVCVLFGCVVLGLGVEQPLVALERGGHLLRRLVHRVPQVDVLRASRVLSVLGLRLEPHERPWLIEVEWPLRPLEIETDPVLRIRRASVAEHLADPAQREHDELVGQAAELIKVIDAWELLEELRLGVRLELPDARRGDLQMEVTGRPVRPLGNAFDE